MMISASSSLNNPSTTSLIHCLVYVFLVSVLYVYVFFFLKKKWQLSYMYNYFINIY